MSEDTTWLKHLASHIGFTPIAEYLAIDEDTVRELCLGEVDVPPALRSDLESLTCDYADMVPPIEAGSQARPDEDPATAQPPKSVDAPLARNDGSQRNIRPSGNAGVEERHQPGQGGLTLSPDRDVARGNGVEVVTGPEKRLDCQFSGTIYQ